MWPILLFGLLLGDADAARKKRSAARRAPTKVAPASPTIKGILGQELLPALESRRVAGEARKKDAEAYFKAEVGYEVAFPDLLGAPLLDATFLDAQLRMLEQRAGARAGERVAAPPVGLESDDVRRWDQIRQATLDAEDQADALRLRYLSGLRAGLAQIETLQDAETAPIRNAWREAREQAQAAVAADPEDDAALAMAGAAGEAEAALQRYIAAALRLLTVPGDARLSQLVAADLQQIAKDAEAPSDRLRLEAMADRLARAMPLLPTGQQVQVDQALDRLDDLEVEAEITRLQGVVSQKQAVLQGVANEEIVEGQLPELRQQLTVAQAAVELSRTELDALGPAEETAAEGAAATEPTKKLAQRKRLRASLQLEVDGLEQTILEARIARAEGASVDVTEQAEIAQRKADEAMAQRQAAEKSREKGAWLDAIAQSRTDTAGVLADEAKRQDQAAAKIVGYQDDLKTQRGELEAAMALPPLDAQRQPQLDATYLAVDRLVLQLWRQEKAQRKDVAHAEKNLDQARGESKSLPQGYPELALEHDDARKSLIAAWSQARNNATNELDQVMALLSEAKADRRKARKSASNTALQEGAADFLDELGFEVREIPTTAMSGIRRGFDFVLGPDAGLWGRVRHVASQLFAIASTSVILLVFFGAYYVARANVAQALRRVLKNAHESLRDRIEGDPRRLLIPGTPALKAFLDLLMAALVTSQAPKGPVHVLGLTWHSWALYKLLPALVPVMFSAPEENRPSLLFTTKPRRERLVESVRQISLVLVVERIAWNAVRDLLDADRMAEVVDIIGDWALVVVFLLQLRAWAEDIRGALQQQEQNKVTRWLAVAPNQTMAEPFMAMLGLVALTISAVGRRVARAGEERAGLSWIASAMARQRLRDSNSKEEKGPARKPLADEQALKIRASEGGKLDRSEQLGEVARAFAEWKEAHRGLAAIIGDRGSGKSDLVAGISGIVGSEMPVRVLSVTRERLDKEGAVQWLGKELEIHAGSADSLNRALDELEPSVFVVEDVHRLFYRTVGGFSPLRAVLNVMHAAGHRHFWVASFHAPAFGYLSGVGDHLPLSAFRWRIRVAPLSPQALQSWLLPKTHKAGVKPAFDQLVAENKLGGDHTLALERASKSYWRVLSDSSQGNPSVAIEYWLRSLNQDGEEGAQVRLFKAPSSGDLEQLADTDLFVLTAVVLHDGIEPTIAAEVLNAPMGRVRESSRTLEGLGVVVHEGARLVVQPLWLPAVQRILRQRHFLHGGLR